VLFRSLDEVSEKTQIRLRSCRRQFDNIKRISRAIEEHKNVNVFKDIFLLQEKMIDRYAAIVFLTDSHFDIQKRKLNHLTLDDLIFCSNQMLKNWSNNSDPTIECDISKEFLIDLKDLKVLIDRDYLEEHRGYILTSVNIRRNPSFNRSVSENFKELSKAVIEIGCSINHSKEMKDLFIDLYEQIIEPCKEKNWNRNDCKLFLDEYRNSACQLSICKEDKELFKIFNRYTETVTSCILQMYQ